MSKISRRDAMKSGLVGLATVGVPGLILRADAQPTVPVLHDDEEHGEENPHLSDAVKPTYVIQAPYYHAGAPFRAKLGQAMDDGAQVAIKGRVWAYDTKKPIPGALIEVFQADSQGVYAMEPGDFRNRARLMTDEAGYYEIETLHPSGYFLKKQNGEKFRYCRPHVHYEVRAYGYKILATCLYFEGDQDTRDGMFDDWAHKSLIMPVGKAQGRKGEYETIVFDLVLIPGSGYESGDETRTFWPPT